MDTVLAQATLPDVDTLPALGTLAHDSRYLVCTSIEATPDWAICRPTSSGGAVLDAGFLGDTASTPDFAPDGYGVSFPESSARCAAAIRRNAAGERHNRPCAPYACLQGYELRYTLMPHWGRKMLMARMGVDPNAVLMGIARADLHAWWPVVDTSSYGWIFASKVVRHVEFFFHLCIAVERARLAHAGTGPHGHALLTDLSVAIADAAMAEIREASSSKVSPAENGHLRARLRAYKALQGQPLFAHDVGQAA